MPFAAFLRRFDARFSPFIDAFSRYFLRSIITRPLTIFADIMPFHAMPLLCAAHA